MHIARWLAVGAFGLLAGCGSSASEPPPVLCAADLEARIVPPTRTLRVGDSLRLEATLLRCNGTAPLATTWTWSARDSSIVRVQAGSGWVYALRIGTSEILAVSQSANPATALTTITVEQRP